MEQYASDPLVGQTIDGRYLIQARLARGGMATVYEALDLRLDRVVALKVMHRHLAEDPDFVSRFRREARSTARLAHPHVVGVFDQGEADDLIYLAMELVPGRTVRDLLVDFGPLAPEQALVILEPVLEGLGAAHAAGFVHRDIKPENVLIADDGRVKVADFGLARALVPSDTSATTGMIIGTVAYLSPEQVERGDADGRSDVYAAGILLFEMVTGRVPHEGTSPLSVAYQHVNADVPPPSQLTRGLPTEVDALVLTATRRDPKQRYQSAGAFLADARRVRNLLPPPRSLAEARTDIVQPGGAKRTARAPRTRTRPDPVPPPAPEGRRRHRRRPPEAPPAQSPPRVPPRIPPGARRAGGVGESGIAPSGPPRRRRGGWIATIAVLAVVAVAIAGGFWLLGRPAPVAVPDLVGLTQEQAANVAAKAGLTVQVASQEFSDTVPAGAILSTAPVAGAGIDAGGTIRASVSKGPELTSVPNVAGQLPEAATQALDAVGLNVDQTRQVYDPTIPSGQVVGTVPAGGEAVQPGASVVLNVSKGPEPVTIPGLAGRKGAAAQAALERLGLQVTIEEHFSKRVDVGDVIASRPKAGVEVPAGSRVQLNVSKGPPPVTVPNLVDMRRSQAIAALERLGLKAKVVRGANTRLDRVISQESPAGSKVPYGSVVVIRII